MLTETHKSSLGVSREDIKLSDKDILHRYLGIDSKNIPCCIQSPLRDDDTNPSFSIFEKDGLVLFKDFGTGEHGNIITLMSLLWHCDYTEALLKLKLDNEGSIPRTSLIRRYNGKLHITSNSSIRVKVREWKEWDLEYWKSYGISESFAKWCNVYPISHAFFTRELENGIKRTVCIPMDKYAYAYFEWKDGKQSIKLYQPFSSSMKWLSKHDSSVWDLWKQAFYWAKARSNKVCIITSSRKDAMCLWESLGVPCMSLQGEGYIPKPQVMQQVLDTFQTVYLWYDNDFNHLNDNPGQDNAKKLCELYPALKNIVIPSSLKCKDPSDLVKNKGVNMLKKVWLKQK